MEGARLVGKACRRRQYSIRKARIRIRVRSCQNGLMLGGGRGQRTQLRIGSRVQIRPVAVREREVARGVVTRHLGITRPARRRRGVVRGLRLRRLRRLNNRLRERNSSYRPNAFTDFSNLVGIASVIGDFYMSKAEAKVSWNGSVTVTDANKPFINLFCKSALLPPLVSPWTPQSDCKTVFWIEGVWTVRRRRSTSSFVGVFEFILPLFWASFTGPGYIAPAPRPSWIWLGRARISGSCSCVVGKARFRCSHPLCASWPGSQVVVLWGRRGKSVAAVAAAAARRAPVALISALRFSSMQKVACAEIKKTSMQWTRKRFTSGGYLVRRKANQSSRVGVVCFLNLPETQEYRSGGLQMLFSSSGSLEFGSPVTRQTRRHGRTVDGMDVVVVKAGVCGRNTRQLGTQLNPGRGPPRSPEHRVLGTYAWADSG